ncbi:MAG: hypothetical protein JO069_14890 [Verrucomicrobia bacterium]|nr:hypothetical protein [Verrucomicrobiota bacterium]
MSAQFFSSNMPVRSWSSGTGDPLISFCADDGRIYCAQFHRLSAVLDEANQRLEVKAPPHGTVIIQGGSMGELCEALCTHRATKIRTCPPEITCVELIPEAPEGGVAF